MQITDSPTTSPSLVPHQSPVRFRGASPIPSMAGGHASTAAGDERERHASSSSRLPPRPRPPRRGPAVHESWSTTTPGTNDIPSLCLSSSSVSDNGELVNGRGAGGSGSHLYTSAHERPSDAYASTSSFGTIRFNGHGQRNVSSDSFDVNDAMASRESQRGEAARRVAAAMQLSHDEILDVLLSMDTKLGDADGDEAMGDFEDKRNRSETAETSKGQKYRHIVDAILYEEDRLAQIESFRSTYAHAGTRRSDMELDPASPRSRTTFERYNHHHHHDPAHAHRHHSLQYPHEGVPPRNAHSRTMPPLSPPPPYDQMDHVTQSPSPGPLSSSPALLPSPREALDSLASSSSLRSGLGRPQSHHMLHHHAKQHYGAGGAAHPYASPVHGRRSSGSRPWALPERSYRSMDDYTSPAPSVLPMRTAAQGVAGYQGDSTGLGLSNGVESPIGSSLPRTLLQRGYAQPRTTSRSPLVAAQDTHDELRQGGVASSPTNSRPRLSPPSKNASRRSRPVPTRHASSDVLGLNLARSASPSATPDPRAKARHNGVARGQGSSSSPPRLSHDEIMARLQRKVKDRIAARSASGSSSIDSGSAAATPASPPSSPMTCAASGKYQPYGGRRRQESASTIDSQSSQGATAGSRRAPRKAVSLKVFPPSQKPVQPQGDNGAVQRSEVTHSPMFAAQSPDQRTPDYETDDKTAVTTHSLAAADDAAGRLGIEALLSAAAIADSPRAS